MIDLLTQLGSIFYLMVLPMLLLIGVGYALQRRFGLDMSTLVRLNFYFIVPAIIFSALVRSELTGGQVGTVVGFQLAQMLVLAGVAWGLAAVRGVPRDQRNALLMSVLFYNSGNYGLPLQKLAWRPEGRGDAAMGLQVFVMVTQNLATFTFAILLASSGRSDESLRAKLMHVVKFPPIYAIAAAGLVIAGRELWFSDTATVPLGLRPWWEATTNIADAFIAVALCTLGAQLALVTRDGGRRYPVSLSVFIRLLLGPAIGLGLIALFGLQGFVAQVLLISTSTPTAVNAMLMCIEFDNHPNFLARAVFYSTLLSPIMVTLTIYLAQSGII